MLKPIYILLLFQSLNSQHKIYFTMTWESVSKILMPTAYTMRTSKEGPARTNPQAMQHPDSPTFNLQNCEK